jgi:hypothetical protein
MSEGEQPTGLDGVTKRRCGRLNKKPLDEDNIQSTATTTGNESRPGLQPREAKVDQDACLVQEVVEIQPDPVADKKSSVKGGLYFANIETNPTLSKITGEPRSGIGAHLTPTKKRRKNKNGIVSGNRLQGRCLMCSKKSTHVCSLCKDNEQPGGKEPWLCYTKNGKLCFANHMVTFHNFSR